MTNINDLYTNSATAEDGKDGYDPLLTEAELPHDSTHRCEVTYSSNKIRGNGGQTFTVKFKVLEGEHKGGEFFDSLHLSGGDDLTPTQLSYNKRLFGKLIAGGCTPEFFAQNPSADAISDTLKGQTLNVKVKWQEPNDKGVVYLDNTTTWTPVGAGGGYVPGATAAPTQSLY